MTTLDTIPAPEQSIEIAAVTRLKHAVLWDAAREIGGHEEEDMGVSIGNETHNHYQGGQPPRPLSLAAKLVVAASLVAGGAGAGVLVNQFLSGAPPASIDTNTATDVTFPE